MTPIRLVIADEHPVVLHGLAVILSREPGIQIVASCRDGAEAFNAVTTLVPDIALLGLSMPSKTGLEILAAVQSRKLTTRIILLSARFDDQALRTAMAVGAHGVILKNATAEEYLDCMADVVQGEKWMSNELLVRIAETTPKLSTTHNFSLERLTAREHEIIKLMQHGLSNKAVARQMNISEGTVKAHLHNIYKKSAAPNRTALAAMVLSHNKSASERD